MATGSGGPLSVTGPYSDGEIPYSFANWWNWSTFNLVVVLRNPEVSQKAVNDAEKAASERAYHLAFGNGKRWRP